MAIRGSRKEFLWDEILGHDWSDWYWFSVKAICPYSPLLCHRVPQLGIQTNQLSAMGWRVHGELGFRSLAESVRFDSLQIPWLGTKALKDMDVSPKPSTTLSEMCFFLAIGCYWLLQIIQEVASICTDMRETPCSNLPTVGFVSNPRQPSRLHSWGAWGNQPETRKPSLRSFRPCEVQLFELVKARYHCRLQSFDLVRKTCLRMCFFQVETSFFFHKDSKTHKNSPMLLGSTWDL